ncbi:NADPH:quinone oxidoreductase family protein [Gordonia sp. LSe1-13]|uniref:NADPH:quinone oxidoreductase family protein n=1 Tax=Gordonia sesuvii TaxID=3116777 RepID=A0ABU7MIX7_9ACTN|nr:NADPH:quinone oxidoreductase family protein [Gordonia sp. LSe1-13]
MRSVPAWMGAWVYQSTGDPKDVLRLESRVPVQQPGEGQVLIRVDAAAVNFADSLVIRGSYQSTPPLPAVAGMEMCGRIVGTGPGVDLEVGERVAGLGVSMSGAFGEYAVMDKGSAFRSPADFSVVESACFTVAYQTAWFALHVRGELGPRESVVVHSAAGGVGLAAVQLAHASGARVIGIVGNEAKIPTALDAGCAEVFVRGTPGLVDEVKRVTGGGADVIIDPVGGPAHSVSERVVRFGGRIVIVGFASGHLPRVRPDLLMVKNYSVVGLHWGLYRSRRPDIVAAEYDRLHRCVSKASIRPVVSTVYDFSEVPKALAEVESGGTAGRVAVSVWPATGDGGPR